jgi:hypothetical protein
MTADTLDPRKPDPVRAAEFAISMELMVDGSMKMYQAALWGGNDHTIAHARKNLEGAYSQFLDAVEAQVIARRMALRGSAK